MQATLRDPVHSKSMGTLLSATPAITVTGWAQPLEA
jgi:cell envelope opacity-associated protein A